MGEILLEWEDHDKNLSEKLWECFREEYLVDFNVTCHGQQMKVHKFILSLLFPMLRESLRSSGTFSLEEEHAKDGSLEETSIIPQNHCLNLDNIADHAEDMDYLIQFAYTGKTTIPKEHADCLMHIAKTMEINSLKNSLGQWHDKSKLVKIEAHDVTRIKKEVIEVSVDMAGPDEETRPDSIEYFDESPGNYDDDDDDNTRSRKKTKRKSATLKRQHEVDHSDEQTVKLVKRRNKITNVKKLTEEANHETSPNKRTKMQTDKTNVSLIKCPQCNFVAKYPSHMNRHLKCHGGKKGPKQFTCRICKKGFGRKMVLAIHCNSKCETQPFVCQYCGHESNQIYPLLEHMMVIHQVDADGNRLDKNVKCPQCDFVCYVNFQLRAHMKTKHELVNKLKCKDCDYSAPYPYLITQHERLKHQNIKNVVCAECEKRFQTTSSVNRHISVVHRAAKPYKCEICGEEFKRLPSYKFHMRNHEVS